MHPSDFFGAQMAFMGLLVAQLDESGAIDGEALVKIFDAIGKNNPHEGQRKAMQMVAEQMAQHIRQQRGRNTPPTSGRH